MRRTLQVAGVSLLALLGYLACCPVPIEPVAWQAPAFTGYAGAHAPNERLAGVQVISVAPEVGPEHVDFGPDGKLYTGVLSGRILRMNPDGTGIETVAGHRRPSARLRLRRQWATGRGGCPEGPARDRRRRRDHRAGRRGGRRPDPLRHTAQGLARELDRMLASPRLETGARAFFDDMLRFDDLAVLAKDPSIYPGFGGDTVVDAREQTLRTVVDHLLVKQRDYRDLFTTRETFLTPSLAVLYGVSVPPGWTPYESPP